MKKLLVILIILGVVGCSSKGTEPQPSKPTEVVVEPTSTPHPDSKINIDLYKVDEYYPVVDGVVTYPDGTTEEFSNGFEHISQGDGVTLIRTLHSVWFSQNDISTYRSSTVNYGLGYDYNLLLIEEKFPVFIHEELPEGFYFRESSRLELNTVDGIIGVEYKKNETIMSYVTYRYCNDIPEGYDINDAFQVITEKDTFYVWQVDVYVGTMEIFGLDEVSEGAVSPYDLSIIINWGLEAPTPLTWR